MTKPEGQTIDLPSQEQRDLIIGACTEAILDIATLAESPKTLEVVPLLARCALEARIFGQIRDLTPTNVKNLNNAVTRYSEIEIAGSGIRRHLVAVARWVSLVEQSRGFMVPMPDALLASSDDPAEADAA